MLPCHGEIRARTFEHQRYRASSLHRAVAAIILWNTVYLSRSVAELRANGETVPDDLLGHITPLGWEHRPFNGDSIWPTAPLTNGFIQPAWDRRLRLVSSGEGIRSCR